MFNVAIAVAMLGLLPSMGSAVNMRRVGNADVAVFGDDRNTGLTPDQPIVTFANATRMLLQHNGALRVRPSEADVIHIAAGTYRISRWTDLPPRIQVK